ncbi:MAG TPA: Fic family protein, partial [Bacteroidales bacterium]
MGREITTEIIEFIKENPNLSSKGIHEGLKSGVGYATVKRVISRLVSDNLVQQHGNGKARKYLISPAYDLFYPIDIDSYFQKEVDDRSIKDGFNFTLIRDVLSHAHLFTEDELKHLDTLQEIFKANSSKLSEVEYKKEMERLSIDLSWKSSQIEGNTYSLLETERLLKEKETASGKTKDEAVMLLNHKDALDFILENPTYLKPLTVARIEDIHSILIKELGVDRNVRVRRVGITGTNYKPLDNEFQIREALVDMCLLINRCENVFEKALLLLVLLSYIQPFVDGNKRMARIVSNA